MRNLRLVLRSLLLTGITLGWWCTWLLGLPLAALTGHDHSWRAYVFQSWGRFMARALGMRVVHEGEPPRGAFLLVTNHLSYVDIVLLASLVRCVFVSKSEVRSWPFIGFFAATMGTLFVDRTRKRDVVQAAERIHALLDRGDAVAFFPEGTSTSGASVEAFRSSLLEPAAQLGLPVRYASLRYATPEQEAPACLSVSWWGDMTLGPHALELLRLPGFEARVVFGEEPILSRDRKELALRLHEAVADRFVPMLPEVS